MLPRRELWLFGAVLAGLVAGLLHEALLGGKVLSPSDVLWVSASFREVAGPRYEPANRLLTDPVLQFEPWLDFTRASLRAGHLPLWNPHAGCGAPLLANGQSAVFDPFRAIAYLGPIPAAYARMAAARLWVAGLGMFLLARSWGLGGWGRWFSGLTFPFCGFLVGWLLYPSASVAVWFPWLFLATDRALRARSPRAIGGLALATGAMLLGGHIQTSAHILLAVGVYAAWRAFRRLGAGALPEVGKRGLACWAGGIALGMALAAIEVVPLAAYLARSPVWADREKERRPAWAVPAPRVLDAVCTALPYAFGSQRRGHPNVAKALGVHNLNESAGGFAGLGTLLWLAPLALGARRVNPRIAFLGGLTLVGALGAFGFPPVDNLLRAAPVLGVTDNRRLVLWVAFGLCLLGGMGLDRLSERESQPIARWWAGLWASAACAALLASAFVGHAEELLRNRSVEHYARAASETPGADPAVYRDRAERQVRRAIEFYPRYLGGVAAHLLFLAALSEAWRRGWLAPRKVCAGVLGLTLIDLFAFGYGLNPAMAAEGLRPEVGVVEYLRREVGPSGRIVALGEELPPNVAMRYGLADVRNYDSVELSRSLAWFAPLYEPEGGALTSRRTVTWDGVIRARERLIGASVKAVVGASPPPVGAFDRVDRVGDVWVARIDGLPWADSESRRGRVVASRGPGTIEAEADLPASDRVVFRETYDPGWGALVDGRPAAVEPHRGTFLAVRAPAGRHAIRLFYRPAEVFWSLSASLAAAAMALFTLTGFCTFRSTRIAVQGLGRSQAVELESIS